MLRHRAVARPAVVTRLLPFQDVLDRLPLDEYAAIWVERMGLVRLSEVAERVVVDMDDLEHRDWIRQLRLHARDGVGGAFFRRLFNAAQSFVGRSAHAGGGLLHRRISDRRGLPAPPGRG